MALRDLVSDLSVFYSQYKFHNNPDYNYNGGLKLYGGRFDQRSLNYGDSDSTPYVVPKLPPVEKDLSPLRNLGITQFAKSKIQETERFAKYITDGGKGVSFYVKQLGLHKSSNRIEPQFNNTIQDEYRNYILTNTLTQIGGQGTGLHLLKHGNAVEPRNVYVDIVKNNNDDAWESENRLIFFRDKLFDEKRKGEIIISYQGGPDSLLGIGNTEIKLYKHDDGRGILDRGKKLYNLIQNQQPSTLQNISYTLRENNLNEVTDKEANNDLMQQYKYQDWNIQSFQQGKNIKRESRWEEMDPGKNLISKDYIKTLGVVEGEGIPEDVRKARDAIKFRIEIVNPSNPNRSEWLVFRSYLTSFNDSTTSNWNEFNYMNRGEVFYTFNNAKSSINLSFTAAILSKDEFQATYQKLNLLKSSLFGDYSNSRLRGIFHKITVGSYLDRVPGIINNLSFDWKTEYPWEIAITEPELGTEKDMQVLPKILDVNFSFTPIYSFLPEKDINKPFIGLRNPERTTQNFRTYSK